MLLTILPSTNDAVVQAAYSAAGEFASALNWELDFSISVRPIGGFGVDDMFRLRQAKCRVFTFPEIPFKGEHTGHQLNRIAFASTPEQRQALTLYREAQSSNKLILSLLLNWQVMDVRPGATETPEEWVNKLEALRPKALGAVWKLLPRLGLGTRPLGDYLKEDCRHAIAHLRRSPGRHVLRFDDREEAERLLVAARVLRNLARHFVEQELKLNQRMFLVRPMKGGFPRYVAECDLRSAAYRIVSPRKQPLFHKIRYPGQRRSTKHV